MDDGTVRSEPCLSGSQISISKREQWKSRFDFLFACVGLSVGLGNVWRFPYLCYKNGGGTFLIPYFISIIAAGIPLFTLEVTLGQLTAQGGIIAWDICPLFRGIGFATLVTIFRLNCYYNVILAWGLYYLFSSFTATLPWTLCGQWWNTEKCDSFNTINGTNGSAKAYNSSVVIDSAVEFWENRVLGLSTGIENMGRIQWHLALCLLLAWVIVFLCVFRGIKASGKVVYFTATAPYLFMFILLGRAVTLEGAVDGLRHFISADWEKLMEFSVGSQSSFYWRIKGIALHTNPLYITFGLTLDRKSSSVTPSALEHWLPSGVTMNFITTS
ncbi:unnamed protein product [Dicrocoelium dendriticum]|nr:unnamed protein product [Dicrocoelium dendriticum]CAH8590811.1 unnamed protein product [Dicrocoelium dendriticum]